MAKKTMKNEHGQASVILALVLLALVALAVVGVRGAVRTTLAEQATQRAEARATAEQARAAAERARTEGLRAAADLARIEADAAVDLLHAETIAQTVSHAVWRSDAAFVTMLGLGGLLVAGLSLLCVLLLRRIAYQNGGAGPRGPRYLEVSGRHALMAEQFWLPAVFVNGAAVICERR